MKRFAGHALREAVERAALRGWVATRTNGGHIRLTHPSGAVVFTSSTTSDRRASANLDAQLRRAERAAMHEGA